MDDLVAYAESRMGKLENGDVAVVYQRLIMRLNAARKNPRYAFIFGDTVGTEDTMVDILCQLLRVADDEQPMAIVQLAGFPAETMEVVVSVLFRLAFEFGVWSDGLSPLLIVCEEAHNYANADQEVGFRAARDGLSRIAKEGRKHGVFLGLVTQRPHQLDPTLMSQCSTVFAMRLGHEDDQKIVRAAVSDAASRQLAFLPSLGTREALVIGAGVPTVMRLRFEALPAEFIPQSQAEWGGRLDAGGRIDEHVIATVVARWRGTFTAARPAAGAGGGRVAAFRRTAVVGAVSELAQAGRFPDDVQREATQPLHRGIVASTELAKAPVLRAHHCVLRCARRKRHSTPAAFKNTAATHRPGRWRSTRASSARRRRDSARS